ncbi:MAG TPA: Dickkopf N-terminal cysteine-rich domain-containing protein [Kofleriaceae bacterium]|nr:Dickkopf N-terminal cysteine-rich domain-containing protein [Kofleriaceae bacterium]
MKKLLSALGLMMMMAFTLTGCELYFGKDGDRNGRGDDEGRPPGWSCDSNADCAAGCYCEGATGGKSGECEEAGFCDSNADCPAGHVCDERSSCVPGTPPQSCTYDQQCPSGAYCNNGTCEASCVCTSDAQAQAAGWHHCDEARQTCRPAYEGATCGGLATCGTEPTCPAGSVGAIGQDGCFTGECNTIVTCDVTPSCQNFQHEVDCLNIGDDKSCSASYTGINCTKPDGSSCQSGDSGCTCQSFVFAECR